MMIRANNMVFYIWKQLSKQILKVLTTRKTFCHHVKFRMLTKLSVVIIWLIHTYISNHSIVYLKLIQYYLSNISIKLEKNTLRKKAKTICSSNNWKNVRKIKKREHETFKTEIVAEYTQRKALGMEDT